MIFVVVFIVCLLKGLYTLPLESEPKCSSRFDFEEKILEKVIRWEIIMESIQKKVEGDIRKLTDDNNNLKLQFQHIEDKAEKQLADINLATDKALTAVTESITDMKTNFESLKDQADATLTDIKDNAEKKLSEIRDLAVKKDVLFHVRDIADQPTAGSVFKFKTVLANTDNFYNIDTGYFTAPRNGTYWFAAQICTHSPNYIVSAIYIRGHVANRMYTGSSTWGDCTTLNVVAILQPGDQATLKAGTIIKSSPIWTDDRYNSNAFMGTMIN